MHHIEEHRISRPSRVRGRGPRTLDWRLRVVPTEEDDERKGGAGNGTGRAMRGVRMRAGANGGQPRSPEAAVAVRECKTRSIRKAFMFHTGPIIYPH